MNTLLHMLGLDADHGAPWRNHYVTDEPDSDLLDLVASGLAEEVAPPSFLGAGDRVFRATSRGILAATAEQRRRYAPRPVPAPLPTLAPDLRRVARPDVRPLPAREDVRRPRLRCGVRRRTRPAPVRGPREWPPDDGRPCAGINATWFCAEAGCRYTRKAPAGTPPRCPTHQTDLRSAGEKGVRWEA